MTFIKKTLLGLFILVLGLFIFITVHVTRDAAVDYNVSLQGVEIPTFTEVEIPFAQSLDNSVSLPFAAGAVIDIDGDGLEEIFFGGGRSQNDVLMAFKGGAFIEIENSGITKKEGEVSHGAAVMDVDGDGDDDLVVVRTDGIWLHRNQGNTFETIRLDANMPDDTTPLAVTLADINRDNHFDMFVAGYIRNDLVEGQSVFNLESYGGSSQMFLNNGDDTFTNITNKLGLDYKHNTFLGVFVDADEDNNEDLIVAYDTGQVRTWRNNGDGTFTNTPNPNSNFNSYPMGIAVGDYDNDGRVDFFFSNVGSTPPNFMIYGDTTDDQTTNWKWLLFRNEGGFQFSDQAEAAKLADYEFSWGAIFEDLNLDGREDLVVSENYIGLPTHKLEFLRLPGRLLVQNNKGEFAAVGEKAGVVNKRYSISPITADFNQDGRPDIVHVNIAGKSKAFLSKPGTGNYLKVRLPNRVSSVSAKVMVEMEDGSRQSKWFISGEGLCSDSSHVMIFGLGKQQAKSISVRYLSGESTELEGPFVNQLVNIKS
jgi:hypothetical protein